MSGGSSKEQTVGYKIFLGLQAILTHGPVDYLLRLRWDDRDAWIGKTAGGSVTIDKPGLFGDEQREGGITGTVDFEQGGPDQDVNDYLSAQMGGSIPAFRGVTSLVMRQLYWGMNPYLKKFSAWLQRIHTTTDGETQWYDAKAAILNYRYTVQDSQPGWKYKVIELSDNTDYHSPSYDDSSWPTGAAPFSDHYDPQVAAYGFNPTPGTVVPQVKTVWMRRKINLSKLGDVVLFEAYVDNGIEVWINGTKVINDYGVYGHFYSTNISSSVFHLGENDIAVRGKDDTHTGPTVWFYFDFRIRDYDSTVLDMNPAHIIRECLINPDWGMGHSAEDINDTDFMAAADQLFDENFGMSILWDKQSSIEEFVKLVLKHIGAVLDIDNTGKWSLRLIRADYVVDDLTVLGPGTISKVDNHTFQAAGEFVNSVTVQYWDSSIGADATVTESDSALCQMQGAVVNTAVNYGGICNKELAARVARRDLLSLSTPLHALTAYVPVQYAKEFENGDVFVMNWPEHKISGLVMRILKIDRGDGKSTVQRFTVSQDVYGLPDSGSVTVSDTDWEDPVSPATALTTRLVMEAPYRELIQISGAPDEVDSKLKDNPDRGFVLASAQRAGSAYTAQLWTDSGAGYAQEGTVDFCPVLQLTADVDYDDTVWAVNDIADADLIEVGMVGQIGEELVVVNAKSSGNVTVGRGVLDTVPAKHVIGDKLIIFDAYAAIDQTEYATGGSVNVKLLPVSGSGPLDIASATADTVTFDRRAVRPYPPGNVKIGGVRYPSAVSGTFTITWSHRNRVAQSDSVFDTTAGDVTPEDNNRYGLRFLDSTDTLIIQRTDIGPGTATVTLNYTGDVTCELYAINNTDESWQRHRFTFAYTPPGGTPVNTITATAYTPVSEDPIIDGGDLDG